MGCLGGLRSKKSGGTSGNEEKKTTMAKFEAPQYSFSLLFFLFFIANINFVSDKLGRIRSSMKRGSY